MSARAYLHSDWRRILKRAWSVRLLTVAAVLSGCEVLLPFIQVYLDVPVGLFAGLSFLVVAAAFAARFVAQKEFLSNGRK